VEKKKRSIVFVDDDKVQHMINRRILKKLNLEVEPIFFDKPYEAIEWLSMNHADVVLLDINMPEMDGWNFLNHLEKKGINVNIKMVTASVDPVDLRRSKEYNQISGFLIKPLEEDTYLEFLGD
jgi:CheY-like chemotaxis protein